MSVRKCPLGRKVVIVNLGWPVRWNFWKSGRASGNMEVRLFTQIDRVPMVLGGELLD